MDAQFEHLCRICAANTKNKTNSVVESVFIFKTQGLKDKISRHLYLNVAEDDPLPKVLCKSCYRQVEATASLSNIAKHTQLVFQDFLLSTLPKNVREAAAAQLNMPPGPQTSPQNDENPKQDDAFRPIMLCHVPETTKPQVGGSPQAELLVTNTASGINRPKPLASSSSSGIGKAPGSVKSDISPTRRKSVFVDVRHGSTPMSIAQRSMQQVPSLVPLNFEPSASNALKKSPDPKLSPAGVINFIQTHGRITGNVHVPIKDDNTGSSNQTATRNAPISSGIPNFTSNMFQQKSRNLKKTLSNIQAMRSGQVSLLKSAQNRKPVQNISPLGSTTLVPQYGGETSVEEALPEHMIFAAPKKRREDHELVPQTSPMKKVLSNTTMIMPATLDLTTSVDSQDPNPLKSVPNAKSLTDAISLGSVIRDPDLLMLILKALKWPVTEENCDEQMSRLKSSKFGVIMSDSNLLQDTDLTQLLGPYLAPMLPIVQQDQHTLSTTSIISSSKATKNILKLTDLSSAMPYKLPPETSVQLVPSSPTEQELPQRRDGKASVPIVKRHQRKLRVRDLHAEDEAVPKISVLTSNAAHVSNELSNINSMLISQFGSNPADALNEALISLLQQQQQESKAECNSANIVNLEDIVLVEPQPPLEVDPQISECVEDNNLSPQAQAALASAEKRPVCKRRKTVIHSSEEAVSKKTESKDLMFPKNQCQESFLLGQSKKIRTEKISSTKESVSESSQAPTSTVPEATCGPIVEVTNSEENPEDTEPAPDNGTSEDTEDSKAGSVNIRKPEDKAALGQKLLEAIGLPQLGKNVAPENSRDTLRSALKRSIKQAQEQQRQLKRGKHEEPVKQQADSTTKLSASESADEHKKAIAERELALLSRGSKAGEESKTSVKDDKSELTDVSSSSSQKRRSRKSKTDAIVEDSDYEERKNSRWDEDDDLPLKTDAEKASERCSSRSSNRPTRTSKTLSKYYKGPSSKSQHAMGTRSTRQR
ncbi:uncharacterized protein LOC108104183 [Drosophila eugracilis]|uniref:uncharacterized protein LOC108104183 n=1 Tax=Drosophila eugracilis TaxID=29029 RepID=UPI001BDA6C46|nr:uncharacterized protein LOC108104183 [Drosophila eugracilis]XP_017065609.2 uncharacterized protein LOC108104183 [Drosophila eugracilis]